MYDLTNVHKLLGIVYPTTRIRSSMVHASWFLGTDRHTMCTISVNAKDNQVIEFTAWNAKTGANVYTASVTFSVHESAILHPEIVGVIYRRVVCMKPMSFMSVWESELPLPSDFNMFDLVVVAIRLSAATIGVNSRFKRFESESVSPDGCTWRMVSDIETSRLLCFTYRKNNMAVHNANSGNTTDITFDSHLQYNASKKTFDQVVDSHVAAFLRNLWRAVLLMSD